NRNNVFVVEPEPGGQRVLPMKGAERTHPLSRVEENFFAIYCDDGEVVVELRGREVAIVKHGAVAVDYLQRRHLQSSGTSHGYKEQGDLIVGSTLLLPHVFGVVDVLGFLLLAL